MYQDLWLVRAELKELKSKEESLLKAIREDISLRGKTDTSFLVDGITVTHKTLARNSVDATRLKEEFPDIYARVIKESIYETVSLKLNV